LQNLNQKGPARQLREIGELAIDYIIYDDARFVGKALEVGNSDQRQAIDRKAGPFARQKFVFPSA
jgi:hypothetical protein